MRQTRRDKQATRKTTQWRTCWRIDCTNARSCLAMVGTVAERCYDVTIIKRQPEWKESARNQTMKCCEDCDLMQHLLPCENENLLHRLECFGSSNAPSLTMTEEKACANVIVTERHCTEKLQHGFGRNEPTCLDPQQQSCRSFTDGRR